MCIMSASPELLTLSEVHGSLSKYGITLDAFGVHRKHTVYDASAKNEAKYVYLSSVND